MLLLAAEEGQTAAMAYEWGASSFDIALVRARVAGETEAAAMVERWIEVTGTESTMELN